MLDPEVARRIEDPKWQWSADCQFPALKDIPEVILAPLDGWSEDLLNKIVMLDGAFSIAVFAEIFDTVVEAHTSCCTAEVDSTQIVSGREQRIQATRAALEFLEKRALIRPVLGQDLSQGYSDTTLWQMTPVPILLSPDRAAFELRALDLETLKAVFDLYQDYLGGRAAQVASSSTFSEDFIPELLSYLREFSVRDWRIGSKWSDASKLQLYRADQVQRPDSGELMARFTFDLNDFNYDYGDPKYFTKPEAIAQFREQAKELYVQVVRLLQSKGIEIKLDG